MTPITKPDVTNEDPLYWEEVLESYQLGTRQLRLQEEPIENPEVEIISLEEIDE